MSTQTPDRTDQPDDRTYPAEHAFSPPRDVPAWRRIEPDLSGGYVEIHLACHAAAGLSPETVTSS